MATKVGLTAKDIIVQEYGYARNMITPGVLGYYKTRDGAAELSVGEGMFSHNNLYGVSAVRLNEDGTTDRMLDSSGVFDTEAEARQRIRELGGHA